MVHIPTRSDTPTSCDNNANNVCFYIGDYIILSFTLWIIGSYLLYLFIELSSFENLIRNALFLTFALFNILHTFHCLNVKQCEIIIFFLLSLVLCELSCDLKLFEIQKIYILQLFSFSISFSLLSLILGLDWRFDIPHLNIASILSIIFPSKIVCFTCLICCISNYNAETNYIKHLTYFIIILQCTYVNYILMCELFLNNYSLHEFVFFNVFINK